MYTFFYQVEKDAITEKNEKNYEINKTEGKILDKIKTKIQKLPENLTQSKNVHHGHILAYCMQSVHGGHIITLLQVCSEVINDFHDGFFTGFIIICND